MSTPNKGGVPATAKAPPLSEETVNKLIQVQAGEQTLRSQELAIRKAEIEYQSKHASDILGAQERDREKQREWLRQSRIDTFLFWGFSLLVAVVFVGSCLYMGKDQIVQDLIKFAIGLLAGGLGGYGYGHKTKAKPPSEDD